MTSLPSILAALAARPVGADAERVRIGDRHVAIISAEALGRALAPWISLSGEFSRLGAYGLQAVRPGSDEPRPVNMEKLAEIIREAVSAWSQIDFDHIADLRDFAYYGGDRADAYFVRAVKAFRASLPAPRRSRGTQNATHKRGSELRLRAAERATADFIIRGLTTDADDPGFIPPGSSLAASDLHAEIIASASELVSSFETFSSAESGYESFAEMADDLGLPSRPRMPRRPVIVEALQSAGFVRYRTGSGNRYRRPSN